MPYVGDEYISRTELASKTDDPWGSLGKPVYSRGSSENRNEPNRELSFTKDGRQYSSFGSEAEALATVQGIDKSNLIYDPTHGWSLPSDLLKDLDGGITLADVLKITSMVASPWLQSMGLMFGPGVANTAGNLDWASKLTDAAGGSLADASTAGTAYTGLTSAAPTLVAEVNQVSWALEDLASEGIVGKAAEDALLANGFTAAEVAEAVGAATQAPAPVTELTKPGVKSGTTTFPPGALTTATTAKTLLDAAKKLGVAPDTLTKLAKDLQTSAPGAPFASALGRQKPGPLSLTAFTAPTAGTLKTVIPSLAEILQGKGTRR